MMEKIALNDRSKRLIMKYLMGGAALGGSAGLVTSLANHFKTLRQEANRDEDTSKDDDTLYLTLRNSPQVPGAPGSAKAAGISDLGAGGVAVTAGTLGALGSYALIRKMYQKIKKKRLQQQLDEAQRAFIDVSNPIKSGAEGKPMGFWEAVGSSPVAFTLLSAIAAGALTNKALDKTFPKVKKPNQHRPKKVVLRNQTDPSYYETVRDEEEEEGKKYASYEETRNEKDTFEDGLEFLVNLNISNKEASASDLKEIVHAVGQGRIDEFCENLMEYGYDHAMTTIKGASETPMSPEKTALAVSACVKSAYLNPTISLLAAAEYTEMAPRFVKAAQEQPEEVKDTLLKIASLMGAINRAIVFEGKVDSLYEVKEAAMAMGLEALLAQSAGAEEEIPDVAALQAPDSETSVEEMQEPEAEGAMMLKKKPKIVEKVPNKDEVDELMSTNISPSNVVS